MSESKLEEAIKFLGRCLKEKGLKVSKIILFGLQAKGTTTEESDVDILIISEEFERRTSLVVEYAKRGKILYAA